MYRLLRWSIFFVMLFMGQPLLAQDTMPSAGLYRVNADGSDLQAIMTSTERTYWSPALSHDGRRIAMFVGTVGKSGGELCIANADGSNLTRLTSNGRANYFPVWSPDDQTIAFISQKNDEPDTAEIYLIQVDGSGETRLTDNDGREYGLSWSPDGSQLVFGSEQDGTWAIYSMNADGSNMAALPTPAHGNSPTLSPDGQQIAFTSHRDGEDDIYMSQLDGSEQHNITNNTDYDDQPVWSPDASRIAFTSYRNERYGIYTIDLNTNETLLVAESSNMILGFPFWSSDSSYIVFHVESDPDENSSRLPQLIIGGLLIVAFLVVVIRFRRRR